MYIPKHITESSHNYVQVPITHQFLFHCANSMHFTNILSFLSHANFNHPHWSLHSMYMYSSRIRMFIPLLGGSGRGTITVSVKASWTFCGVCKWIKHSILRRNWTKLKITSYCHFSPTLLLLLCQYFTSLCLFCPVVFVFLYQSTFNL